MNIDIISGGPKKGEKKRKRKGQPKINYFYLEFKIHISLRYHLLKDLQLLNFLSSAKISKPKID